MYLINNAIICWNSAIIIAVAEGWECLYWHAPFCYRLSNRLFHNWPLLRSITCNTCDGGVHRSIQNFSENLSLVPSEACDGYPGTDRKSDWATRMQTHQYPVFYHGNSIKLNEVCLSPMWRSKPCNYMVRSLKKLHLCGCLKWRHISEMFYRQLKIPDAISFHHRRAGIAMVPNP